MAGKIYKTAQGVTLDIDHLRLINESVVAVGNMGVNSRGDRVNPDGSIKESRNDIMKKAYRTNATVAGKGVLNSQGKIADTNATTASPSVTSSRRQPVSAPAAKAPETTPEVLRGSLAQAINDNVVPDVEEESDLLNTTPTTRTITRI